MEAHHDHVKAHGSALAEKVVRKSFSVDDINTECEFLNLVIRTLPHYLEIISALKTTPLDRNGRAPTPTTSSRSSSFYSSSSSSPSYLTTRLSTPALVLKGGKDGMQSLMGTLLTLMGLANSTLDSFHKKPHTTSLKFKIIEVLSVYFFLIFDPAVYAVFESSEASSLDRFSVYLNEVVKLLPAWNNKKRLLNLGARIIDGHSRKYITGSGATDETTKRWRLIEIIGGLHVKPEKKLPALTNTEASTTRLVSGQQTQAFSDNDDDDNELVLLDEVEVDEEGEGEGDVAPSLSNGRVSNSVYGDIFTPSRLRTPASSFSAKRKGTYSEDSLVDAGRVVIENFNRRTKSKTPEQVLKLEETNDAYVFSGTGFLSDTAIVGTSEMLDVDETFMLNALSGDEEILGGGDVAIGTTDFSPIIDDRFFPPTDENANIDKLSVSTIPSPESVASTTMFNLFSSVTTGKLVQSNSLPSVRLDYTMYRNVSHVNHFSSNESSPVTTSERSESSPYAYSRSVSTEGFHSPTYAFQQLQLYDQDSIGKSQEWSLSAGPLVDESSFFSHA